MKIFASLIAVLVAVVSLAADQTYLTVRAVKAKASKCTSAPVLEILTHSDQWLEKRGLSWNGENERELFFTLAATAPKAPMPRLAVKCPGVTIERVLVGKTDVKFSAQAERVEFDAVPDKSVGTLINNQLPDPTGDGLPIGIYHNWRIRQDGQFAGKPYPEAETKAVLNYLVAAREALRLMGDMGPKDKRSFDGYISLLSFEVACGRGHNDAPPHVHIMLYVPTYTPGSQVPHFYMDSRGRIVRNSFTELGVKDSKRAGEYGPGRVCQMYDLKGNLGLECIITKEGGLILRKREGADEYLLIGDEKLGPAGKVWVVVKGQKKVSAVCADDAEHGVMKVAVLGFKDGRVEKSVTQVMRYDPFSSKVLEMKTE